MREITELNELKKIELEIMKKIHLFCDENQIEYYLAYGSLIGAVRHGGFIPWDDDIDIFMTRENYDLFLQKFPFVENNFGLKIVNHLTKPYYGRNLTKVIDTATVLIEPQYKTDDPIGVFVDIWPLDGLPNNAVHRWLYIKKSIIMKKMILASSMKYNCNYSLTKKVFIMIGQLFKAEKLVKHMDKIARKYDFNESNYVQCYPAKHVLYKREYFKGRFLINFEDTSFYAPQNYDNILTAEYGNYMELPPKEMQLPHHVMNTYYKDD